MGQRVFRKHAGRVEHCPIGQRIFRKHAGRIKYCPVGQRILGKHAGRVKSCPIGQRIFGKYDGGMKVVSITSTLNEVLVRLFRDINAMEEQAIKTGEYRELTINDMHVIEAIDIHEPKNMSSVAHALMVTTGTLTISVNGLVKKGYVRRDRSEKDRRVVLVSLTEKGGKAFAQHKRFHQRMIEAVVEGLNEEEQVILEKALQNINRFFRGMKK